MQALRVVQGRGGEVQSRAALNRLVSVFCLLPSHVQLACAGLPACCCCVFSSA